MTATIDNTQKWQKEKGLLILILVLGTLLACVMSYILIFSVQKITELKNIENLRVTHALIFKRTGGKNSRQWYELQTAQFKHPFRVPLRNLRCSSQEIFDLKENDLISVKLEPEAYEYLMEGDPNRVYISAIKHREKELMDLNCINREISWSNTQWLILSLSIIILSIVFLKIQKIPTILGFSPKPVACVLFLSIVIVFIADSIFH